jgi:hypothetical protein
LTGIPTPLTTGANVANGYAGLDSSGLVSGSVLPATVVTTTGTQALTNKTLTSPTITSPAGITKSDVGLSNVDNTSDATERAAVATLTNKRVTPRVNTVASSATPAINTDTTDLFTITALAANITSMTSGLTGTPTDGQKLMIRIKGAAAQTITWGASFISSGVATLLASTVAGKTHTVGLVWDSAVSDWVCVAVDAAGY